MQTQAVWLFVSRAIDIWHMTKMTKTADQVDFHSNRHQRHNHVQLRMLPQEWHLYDIPIVTCGGTT